MAGSSAGPSVVPLQPGLTALARLTAEATEMIGRFDHVTRLPNRLQFVDHFRTISADPGLPEQVLVLVALDEARHFNELLRALGHGFADDFVRAGAAMLAALLPETTKLFHVSVLSFAFTLDHDMFGEPPAIAAQVQRAFNGAVLVDDIPIRTGIGIGLMPLKGVADGSEALRGALVAAQDSRRFERGMAFYNHRSDAAHIRAFKLLTDLPAALASSDQLRLHFQPRIDLATGHCVGAEALLRWTHPTLGVVAPGEFIPLAEQTVLIGPITDWVLNAAMADTRDLLRANRQMRISINASPLNLAEVGFDEKLLHLCTHHGLEPEHFELEFTEGALVSNAERTTEQLEALRAAGVEIAIDDFGSGYSNLAYLTGIPADVLKIDQSLIRPVGGPRNSDFLVRQIVAMAKGLGFRVCAEGIETTKSYKLLTSIGCQEGQGFLIAKPMPVADFAAWLDKTP